MKSLKTFRRDTYKRELTKLLDEHPEARMVAKKYKVLAFILNKEHSAMMGKIKGGDSFINFLQDVIYIDRLIRKETEGVDDEKKKILSQEKQVELGYEGGANVKLKNL